MDGFEGTNTLKKKKVGNYVFSFSECLGQGQYGKVYLAKNKTNNMKAAIKVIDKNKSNFESI